jgi:hypothetical protein
MKDRVRSPLYVPFNELLVNVRDGLNQKKKRTRSVGHYSFFILSWLFSFPVGTGGDSVFPYQGPRRPTYKDGPSEKYEVRSVH